MNLPNLSFICIEEIANCCSLLSCTPEYGRRILLLLFYTISNQGRVAYGDLLSRCCVFGTEDRLDVNGLLLKHKTPLAPSHYHHNTIYLPLAWL